MSATTANTLFSDNTELQELLEKAYDLKQWNGGANRVKLYKSIIQKADALNLEKEKVHALALLARYAIAHEQYSKGLEYIFQGLPLAQKYKMNDRISNFYNWLASAHMFVGDYSNALDYYQLEIKHNIENSLEKRCYIAYSMIACIYAETGSKDAAERFYEKTSAIAKKYPDYEEVYHYSAQVSTGIIFLKIEKGEYDEAKKLCYEAIEKMLVASIQDGRMLPSLYSSLALIAYKTGNYEEGIKHVQEAEKWKSGTDEGGRAYLYYVLALNQLHSGDKKEAMLAFDECVKCFPLRTQPTTPREIEVLNAAKDFYEKIGDREKLNQLQKMISQAEIDLQTLQAKLAIRAEQLLAVTTKYAPVNQKPDSGKISLWVIGSRTTDIPIEKIAVCQTFQGKENRNTCGIEMIDTHKTYKVPLSLRKLYDRINNPNFVWLSRNVFINKSHIADWTNAVRIGRVVLNGNSYDISRRNWQALKTEMNL